MLPTLSFPRTAVRRGTDWSTDVNRFFDEFFTPRLSTWSAWTPAADLYETDDEFVLEMEMPGFNKDDIEVTVEHGILSVSGRRTAEREEGERLTYHVRERSYDRFNRSFSLPRSVDAEHVNAEYRNGILRVTLPKLAEAKPRQIAVKAS